MDQDGKSKMLENAFSMLKKHGHNNADGILQFLKDRNLLDEGTAKLAKSALSESKDPGNIDFNKFSQVVDSVAKQKDIDAKGIGKKIFASLFGCCAGKSDEPSTSAHERSEEHTGPEAYEQHTGPEAYEQHTGPEPYQEHTGPEPYEEHAGPEPYEEHAGPEPYEDHEESREAHDHPSNDDHEHRDR